MKSNQKGFIIPLLIIIIALLVIGAGVYEYQKNINPREVSLNTEATSTTQTTTASTSSSEVVNIPADQPNGWQTYTDSKNGYQIKYPPTFTRQNIQGGDNPTLSFQIKYPSSYFTGTNLDDASIMVETSTTNESACYSSNNYGANPFAVGLEDGKPEIVVLNGITFHAVHAGDAAMGHNYEESYLNTFHNGLCYSIMANAQSFKPSFYDSSQPQSKVAAYNPDTQIFPIFNQVASTFNFISQNSPNIKPVINSVSANMSTIGLLMTVTGNGFTTASNVIYIDNNIIDNGQPRSSMNGIQIDGAFPILGGVGSQHQIYITNENGVSNSFTFSIKEGAKTTDPRYPL